MIINQLPLSGKVAWQAVCCSVLQCVLQYVGCGAVCRSVLQCVTVRHSVLRCVPVCCSAFQYVAVCGSVSSFMSYMYDKTHSMGWLQ